MVDALVVSAIETGNYSIARTYSFEETGSTGYIYALMWNDRTMIEHYERLLQRNEYAELDHEEYILVSAHKGTRESFQQACETYFQKYGNIRGSLAADLEIIFRFQNDQGKLNHLDEYLRTKDSPIHTLVE
jgi:hypothetical protein